MPWIGEDAIRLAGFRTGDGAVLADVYLHYAPGLQRSLRAGLTIDSQGVRHVISHLAGAWDLDDAVQETFLRAFSVDARKAYDPTRPFSAWLTAIARNLLIDRHRSARHTVPLADDAFEDAAASPEATTADRQVERKLQAFLVGLDDQERLLVELRLERGAPRREVEARTGWSAMQVRVREKRLFARLLDVVQGLRTPHSRDKP